MYVDNGTVKVSILDEIEVRVQGPTYKIWNLPSLSTLFTLSLILPHCSLQ